MTANNVFRFVTVRPPALDSAAEAQFVTNDAAAQETAGLLQQRMVGRVRLPEARVLVAGELYSASAYYRKSPHWAPLRSSVSDVAAALSRLTDRAGVEMKTADVLAPVMGGDDVHAYLASDRHARLREQLWKSYHATVLDPALAPQDREEISTWLRFFALLDALPDTVRLASLLTRIATVRIGVPLEFFREAMTSSPPTENTGQSPSPGVARIAQLDVRLAALLTAREFLAELYSDKVAAFRNALGSAPSPTTIVERDGKRGHGSPDNLNEAPWRLKAGDFAPRSAVLTSLRAVGLEPLTLPLPRLVHEVELKIAVYRAELARWGQRNVVTFAGRALVNVTRFIS